VVITHRTHLLAAVDKLMILREGQMQAFGPRDEVLAALKKAMDAAQQSQAGAGAASGGAALRLNPQGGAA